MKLAKSKILITGSNQGFGLAVARAFIAEGADVAICARDENRLNRSLEELFVLSKGESRILAYKADVSKLEDVQHLFKYVIHEFGGLDVLLCNAGVYGPKGPFEEVDWSEWARTQEININGTVLPCREVLPIFKKKQRGKIIILSGGGATKPMPFLSAYAASKAAVVRFAETLAEEVKNYHIEVNSIAPGALNTRLLDEVLNAGPERVGNQFYEQMLKVKKEGGTPLEVGAALCVFLASAESDGISGKLISAVWDPWRDKGFQDRLREVQDFATLRRIDEKYNPIIR
jgi:NAD(P)-dependent dehydrogenase (short-subunit alcohol dehydrogenase family)